MSNLKSKKQIAWLKQEIADQKKWIEDHGGDLVGYIARYGSKGDADHYGDGGEAIYKADTDALKLLEMKLSVLTPTKEPEPVREYEDIFAKISDGVYETTAPYAGHGKPGRNEYMADYRAKEAQFKADLISEFGMTNHPKAEKVFALAWENGHAYGLHDVACHFQEYAELVKD